MVRKPSSALGALLLLSSFTTSKAAIIKERGLVTPSTLPGTWVSEGCYVDVGRTLTGGAYTNDTAMTDESCIAYCEKSGFIYAGTEYSQECYCGNSLAAGGVPAPTTDCSMACTGNSSEACGGPNRLNLFWSSTTGPQTNHGVGLWTFSGCYAEGTTGRALTVGATTLGGAANMTVANCLTACQAASYNLAGVEYSGECYCGDSIQNGGELAPDGMTGCNMLCNGNFSEFCGGSNRLDLYDFNNQVSLPPYTTTSSASSAGLTTSTSTGSSTASTTSTSTTLSSSTSSKSTTATTSTGTTSTTASVSVTTSPTATGFPTGWTYQGCWVDGTYGRILTHQQPDEPTTNSLQSCVATCAGLGYTIAGTEYAVECYCDNFVYNGAVLATNQADCGMPCPGAPTEMCGAGNRLSIYSIGTPTVYAPPAPQKVDLPTGWTYSGCIQDNIASNEDANEILSTFPYMAWQNETFNSPAECIAQCQLFGYNAAGLEYGSQCFCGDVENIYVASAPSVYTDPDDVQYYTRSAIPQVVSDSNCNVPCAGLPQYYCGAGNLLNYYSWNASTPLYEWGMPSGDAAGTYSLLIGGVVVPLIVSQGVNGKVSFLEKHGTGEPNGTGAFELDLSLVNNYQLAWREMTGLQSDVFCAAGLTLPDKAGRQLTAGGWAGNANFGVRLYWPDGSAGINGTNEWVEDLASLKLQVPRWYPSGMIMANGSILIVGGEIGQNDPEQPTLEILPATGVPDVNQTSGYSNTTVYLDFLARTWPFNLYPFVCVIPQGIFIAYYNEARILDEKTFETITILPNMPGAVNDPDGGRTYQLEGAMVLLPQYAPYTKPLGVLICGGSTSGADNAIDNCISTQPGATNPTWTIERMPSRRVMPCMAGLPDGTYIILNGAQHGVAGFGLAGSPNYNAVLYDPSKPVNQRMSIMANTTVARLYHSEATVLLDGRVLVSGSDPSGQFPTPPGTFPEEYRIEVFTPPYLLSGLARPTFTVTSTDWAYGEVVTFTVTSGSTANLKVSLLGSTVSTHGNAMGQRTIFPAFSCSGTTCTVTAPPDAHTSPPGWFMMFVLDGPTPSIGQFVRIGGDPAGLGNWPQLPGFDLPGV